MSAIAGLVTFDGRPSPPDVLHAMAAAMSHRSPGGSSIWHDGGAGFVHGRLVTTPESAAERQPFVDAAARLTITFDGRLDNRAELIAALGLDSCDGRSMGDAEVTLRAYRTWDAKAVDRLLGVFAFAIWDAGRHRLFCARDAMGVRPFCYRVIPAAIAWASDAGVLARCAGPMPLPNEGMAAEFLSGVITNKRETLFQGIYRLPPAHRLTATADGVAIERYWQPEPFRTLRYSRDDEYDDHLSELIHRVVADRLRTNGRVGVMLSGGVDSSTVTGVATQLVRSGSVACPGVETFSISVPGPNDEREFFEQVRNLWQLPSHVFGAQLPTPGQFRAAIARDLDIDSYAHAPTIDPLLAVGRDRGIAVMLTGIGADDWLGTTPWAYADLMRKGRLLALARRMRLDARLEDFVGWREAAKSAVWPLVPSVAKRVVRRALGRGRPPAWLNSDFAARTGLAERLARHDDGIAFLSFEQSDMWHEGTSGAAVHSFEMFDRSGARFGMEHWHPFLDRRIVEFGLALPADQRWRNGRAKDLLRRAMAPHVPPAIAGRLFSPDASHTMVQAIDAEGGPSPFETMTSERLGWIVGARIRALLADMMRRYHAGDDRYSSPASTLWLVLAMDFWLEAVADAAQTSVSPDVALRRTVVQ